MPISSYDEVTVDMWLSSMHEMEANDIQSVLIQTSSDDNYAADLATVPAFVAYVHAVADFIDASRANGISVGEAFDTLCSVLAPFANAPHVDR